ncbi:hypothetical protein JN11_03637 [Mucilaginibacter frigoritolerans]|uniref:Uncharacterized protein n=1 Tax=Mucilaginibacter frigoritolerans TaxID=652788 RepID=A0A562TUF5_9SPHI|nr:hypothetical protein [Mucilaginibacter frigoritolerans]TWI97177.1 hypothetical protein JN11_03637 [Mucilaginibacter frigoritolerans]
MKIFKNPVSRRIAPEGNKKTVRNICIAVIVTLFFSCCDIRKVPIGYMKNNMNHDIIAANWFKDMNDSLLYNDRIYMGYYIQPKLTETMATGYGGLFGQPDSVKAYIYVFNPDSIDKYRNLKIQKGIFKNSLLKKIEIQVKEPLDTIYINSK